ncbi:MAG: hypothetical protein ACRDH5_04540 [bacterium]
MELIHDIAPGATQAFHTALNGQAEWDQPFFSVSGPPGSASDLDIVLTDGACTSILAGIASVNVGGDPVEVFSFTNAGPTTTFGVAILQFSGPNPGLMKTVNVGSGSITIDQFDTKTGASWGHSAALAGLGVRYRIRPWHRPWSGPGRRRPRVGASALGTATSGSVWRPRATAAVSAGATAATATTAGSV